MAQVDYFLTIEGIEGESQDEKHKGALELLSWSWGETNSGAHGFGGGGGAGKVSMRDFDFVMNYNKASPKLMLACATGQHIPKVTLTCRKAGGKQEEYLVIELKNVLISSYQTGGSTGDVIPVDTVAINFTQLEMKYKPQDEKGSLGNPVKAGYDVKLNKKI